MVIKRVGPLSLARINGLIGVVIGLIAGLFFSFLAVPLAMLGSRMGDGPGMGPFGFLFGMGAIIFLPIFYGVLGFVGGLIVAAVYNLGAGWFGGIEIDTE